MVLLLQVTKRCGRLGPAVRGVRGWGWCVEHTTPHLEDYNEGKAIYVNVPVACPAPLAIPRQSVKKRGLRLLRPSCPRLGAFSTRASVRNAWRRFGVVMNARTCIGRFHVKRLWQLAACYSCFLVKPMSGDTRMCTSITAFAGPGPRSKTSLLSPYVSVVLSRFH